MGNEKLFASFDKFPHGEQWTMWKKPYDTHLFLYLLTHANIYGKQWNSLFIERGQLVTSLESLKAQTGLTIQQARTALNHLQAANLITSTATNKFRIISICNYDCYNGFEDTNQQAEQQALQQSEQQATNKQTNNSNRIDRIIDKIENKSINHIEIADADFLVNRDLLGMPKEYVLNWYNGKLRDNPCKANIRTYFTTIWENEKYRLLQVYQNQQGLQEQRKQQEADMNERKMRDDMEDKAYLKFCHDNHLNPDVKDAATAFAKAIDRWKRDNNKESKFDFYKYYLTA